MDDVAFKLTRRSMLKELRSTGLSSLPMLEEARFLVSLPGQGLHPVLALRAGNAELVLTHLVRRPESRIFYSYFYDWKPRHDGALFRNDLPVLPTLPLCSVRERHGFRNP